LGPQALGGTPRHKRCIDTILYPSIPAHQTSASCIGVFIKVKISPHPRWLLTGVTWWKNGYAYGGGEKRNMKRGKCRTKGKNEELMKKWKFLRVRYTHESKKRFLRSKYLGVWVGENILRDQRERPLLYCSPLLLL
jgi:hypothetical protein